MREIVLDTETTGLDPTQGHRIVEIGAVELWNQMPTGKTYHQYINPQRSMPEEAFAVHGLSEAFLSDKPIFEKIAQEFLDFVQDSKMVIHNASFDMRFLNHELSNLNLRTLPNDQAIDTLMIARRKFPGASVSLDSLCRRFNIDNSMRTLHGALLDSEILAEIYLELTGGRQPDFELGQSITPLKNDGQAQNQGRVQIIRPRALTSRLTQEEKDAHNAFVKTLGDEALWKTYQ
ncbi:MAG: DNA polymerase III subunit epsilon [Paracoccaceae bacterium]